MIPNYQSDRYRPVLVAQEVSDSWGNTLAAAFLPDLNRTIPVFARSSLPLFLPQTPFYRSGPPFVIRSVLIRWGCPGLQMVNLSEKTEFGGERGAIVQTQNNF